MVPWADMVLPPLGSAIPLPPPYEEAAALGESTGQPGVRWGSLDLFIVLHHYLHGRETLECERTQRHPIDDSLRDQPALLPPLPMPSVLRNKRSLG